MRGYQSPTYVLYELRWSWRHDHICIHQTQNGNGTKSKSFICTYFKRERTCYQTQLLWIERKERSNRIAKEIYSEIIATSWLRGNNFRATYTVAASNWRNYRILSRSRKKSTKLQYKNRICKSENIVIFIPWIKFWYENLNLCWVLSQSRKYLLAKIGSDLRCLQ